MIPLVIEDVNRNEYLESMKKYREENKISKLISLFKKEQEFYFEKCKYFMGK